MPNLTFNKDTVEALLYHLYISRLKRAFYLTEILNMKKALQFTNKCRSLQYIFFEYINNKDDYTFNVNLDLYDTNVERPI